MSVIDSDSVGDPKRFLGATELEEGLKLLHGHHDEGVVALLMRRGEGGRREPLDHVILAPKDGVPGDAWGRSARPKRSMQIAVMQKGVAELIANGQPFTLFGDCLILDLDLSTANLPAGSRVQVGEAILEVTPEPHNGCRKFQSRFGNDALRFVSMPRLRHRNLRGIYMCVVEPGAVRTGDPVRVISRTQTTSPRPIDEQQSHVDVAC